MSFVLFVGDINEELADTAKKYDKSASLLTAEIFNNIHDLNGTYYTSLADLGSIDDFNIVCLKSDKIFYHPPACWSNLEQKKWTEIILWNANQYKPIQGLTFNDKEQLFIELSRPRKRLSESQNQLWTAGCSITAGVGVESQKEWPFIVSNILDIPYTNISVGGSSIIWSSYQICQLPVIPGDLVFWGLTYHYRLPMLNSDEKKIWHVVPSQVSPNNRALVEALNSDSLLYHNLMAIKNANNFCEKAGAKLVIMGLIYDWDSFFKTYQIKNFKQYITWPRKYLDLGTDNLHPGPMEHKAIAENFLEFYQELYG